MGLLHERRELASVCLTLCKIEVLKDVDAVADANLFLRLPRLFSLLARFG
jgi:hypothetical protein